MSQVENFFKHIIKLKSFMFELHLGGHLGCFDGLEWEHQKYDMGVSFESFLSELISGLSSQIQDLYQHDLAWRADYVVSDVPFHLTYSPEYKSLRISKAPSAKATLNDWGFTETQIKSLSQPSQIALVVGPQGSGKGTVQKLLMRNSSEAGVQCRVMNESKKFLPAPRQWYFSTDQIIQPAEVASLSLKGQSICYGMEALDLEAALLVFFEKHPEVFKSRLVMNLTVIETRLLPGLEQVVVPFSSFYQLRYCPSTIIDRFDWNALMTWQEGQKENFNIRTLNQVLIQGIIRRKIDMKTAFAASPHPEGLDHMLKRIGV